LTGQKTLKVVIYSQGRRQKNVQEGKGQREKRPKIAKKTEKYSKDRKIALLSLFHEEINGKNTEK